LRKILSNVRKRKKENVVGKFQIAYISPSYLPTGDDTTLLLQELGTEDIQLTFAYVPLPAVDKESGELNFGLAQFAIELREHINCSLVRVENCMLFFPSKT
jgi:hypothetical protein